MPEHTSILNILLTSIFIGFGIVVPILALLKTSDLTRLRFKELFILTAVQAVRVGGVLYFLLFAIEVLTVYFEAGYTHFSYAGPYWLYYWFPPVIYLALTQLLWIKKLFMNRWTLITLSLLMLILPSRRFISFLVSLFQNDYLPSSWTMFIDKNPFTFNPYLQFILNIIVFIFIIFTIMLAGNKFKKIKE